MMADDQAEAEQLVCITSSPTRQIKWDSASGTVPVGQLNYFTRLLSACSSQLCALYILQLGCDS